MDLRRMGVSGTGFGMRALFGSNADRVLRQAPCPVLIARPLRPELANSQPELDICRRGGLTMKILLAIDGSSLAMQPSRK